jgi:hypothetical protein
MAAYRAQRWTVEDASMILIVPPRNWDKRTQQGTARSGPLGDTVSIELVRRDEIYLKSFAKTTVSRSFSAVCVEFFARWR